MKRAYQFETNKILKMCIFCYKDTNSQFLSVSLKRADIN